MNWGGETRLSKNRVLIVEDATSLALTYREYLKKLDCELSITASGLEALQLAEQLIPQVMLLDLGLPDLNGMEVLKTIKAKALPITIIVITAQAGLPVVIEAMRNGAYDFLVKPIHGDRLLVTVRNALERLRLETIVATYRDEIDRHKFHKFIGASLPMQAVYRMIDAAASSKAPVFITGESGTGKELCAEAIHARGARASKPFIALNCAALPKDLIESEVFGHVRGAFTGATQDRAGAASLADGGTLFLDEIAEMDISLQSKLLRFLQTGKFRPVGGNQDLLVDIRIIAATNRDPQKEIELGRFREDLFYRLYVLPIALPPLRHRDGDILDLAVAFLTKFSSEEGKHFQSFSPNAAQALSHYHWPGNVRQVENVIRQIVVMQQGNVVDADMLPTNLRKKSEEPDLGVAATAVRSAPFNALGTQKETSGPEGVSQNVLRPLWLQEKEIVEQAIQRCDGNIPKAAEILEVSPSTLYRKIQIWQQKT